MKKLLVFMLTAIMLFTLFSCDEKEDGTLDLSGETVWLPYIITATNSDGETYDMQTIDVNGSKTEARLYNSAGKLISGYDLDLIPIDNTLEIKRISSYSTGKITYALEGDMARIVEKTYYDINEPSDYTTTYDFTYNEDGTIAKLVTTQVYEGDDEGSSYVEERLYTYGDTSYTIAYVSKSWIGYAGDDNEIVYRKKIELVVPYDNSTGNIKKTVSFVTEDGDPIAHDDYFRNDKVYVEKIEYEINKRGFCVSNVYYLTDGTTLKNIDLFEGYYFDVAFNDNGMPTSYAATGPDGYSFTGTYTYDDNGNLTNFVYNSSTTTFSYELKWKEFPKEAAALYSAYANSYDFAISEVIEDACPEIAVGPAEMIYKKSDMLVK